MASPGPRERVSAIVLSVLLLASAVSTAAASAATFREAFDEPWALEEAGSMARSASPDWWVNSGAWLFSGEGIGSTVLGTLGADDPWRLEYADSNPVDTDGGYRPQNVFRVLRRKLSSDFAQQLRFRIRRVNPSDSPNRNATNGVLLFLRYQNEDNLYYAGIRVDGAIVLKKKLLGRYTTLASRRLYGREPYDRDERYNFLPGDRWLGLRTEIRNELAGTVRIRVWFDHGTGGGFVPVLEARDVRLPILPAGHAGIRTDFMDVELDDYESSGD